MARLSRILATLALALGGGTGCKSRAPQPAPAATLAIAAAADLRFALETLVKDYAAAHPEVVVNVTYGSSGNFFTQLQNRAPFDLYLSADAEYPRRLAAAGLALDHDVFLYGVGELVLWAPSSSPVKVEQQGLQALADPSVKKIAIANPQHAPYGRAAVAALKSLGAYEQAAPKLVYGENIAQAAQFVQSGAADLGILALSLALAPEMRAEGRFWPLPPESHPPLEQGGIILQWTRSPAAAQGFRDHLLSAGGRALLLRYGFHAAAP